MASIYSHSWCGFSAVGCKGFCRIQDSLIATIAIIPTAIIQYAIKTGRFQPRAIVGEEIEMAEEIEVGNVTGASEDDVGRSR